MTKIKELYKGLHHLALGWSWKRVDRRQRMVVAFFRMLWITFKGFRDDLVTLRAASLTYITLVSIIPTLVFSFAVSKGIGATGKLIEIIRSNIAEFPEGAQEALNKIIETVQAVDYTKMGTTGFLLAAFTAIKLLGKVEHSLNDIWGVKQHRTMMRKFSDYISTIVMIPVLILASSAVTVMLKSESVITKIDEIFGPAAIVVEQLMSLSGLFVIIFAFFLLYIWLPNTKVKVWAAFVGGVVGGLSWKLMLLIFVNFQAGLTDSSAVYGTFAALPLFLVWVYSSWVIVLFGAEVAFSAQHWRTYDLNSDVKKMNFSSSLTLALIIMKGVIEAFREGEKWCPDEFSDNNMLSVKSVLAISDLLVENGLLELNKEPILHFIPARTLENISVGDVVKAVAGKQAEYLQSADSLKTGLVECNGQEWDKYISQLSSKGVMTV